MSHRPRQWAPGRSLAALVWVLALGAALAAPARGADAEASETSLRLVPADASFYTTMLRNREQLDAVLKSRAWARLQALPAVKTGLQAFHAQLDNPQFAGFLKLLEQPENRELVELLGEMVSDEVFCYGGESFNGFIDLAGQVVSAVQYAPAMAQLTGQGRGAPGQMQGLAALRVLAANPDLIRTPDLVIGFKLRDARRAESQLKRLEKLVEAQAEQFPPLKEQVKRVRVGTSSFLTLTLDGAMVPWEKSPIKDLEEKPGEFDALLKKLSKLKATVSLGVKDSYLLLGVGASTDHLAQLGGKGDRLQDRPELKPLAKFAGRRLTSIGYLSKALHAKVGTNKKDIDGLVELANSLLAQAKLPEEQSKRIGKDLKDLAGDIKKLLPEVGAMLSFSFLTERGQETYAYDYGKHTGVDVAEPLTILDHVGGNPILAAAGRSKPSVEEYRTLVKWLQKAYGHVEDIALTRLDDDQKEKYHQTAKALFPLLKRLDENTATRLLPALADGQLALVIDAKWSSRRWIQALPETAKPLPMLEPALVIGVSDAELLRKAMAEYRIIANELVAKVRELAPDKDVPDFKVPLPEVEKGTSGTLFWYPLPAQAGLDKRVVPTGGLSEQVAVLALSHAHADRLLARKPLKIDGGPLADRKRPLLAAAVFDWPALVDAATPWVEMGAQMAVMQWQRQRGDDEEKDGREKVEDVLKQVRTVLEVLKVFRGSTSVTYLEDGVLVTHSESVIRDLKEE